MSIICDFCQRPKSVTGELIGSPDSNVHVCRHCIKNAKEQIKELPNGSVTSIAPATSEKEGV